MVELLVVIAIIGILVALLLPAVQAAREAARRTQCINNLKQIGLAWINYHDVYRAFPTAGDNGPDLCCSPNSGHYDRYSWTFHILPFSEQKNLYEVGLKSQSQLGRSIVPMYYCQSRRQVRLYKGRATSDYAASRGTSENGLAMRSVSGWIGYQDVTDGSSNTLMVAETRVHQGFIEEGGCCSDNESAFLSGYADDVVRSASKPPAPDLVDSSLVSNLVDGQFGSPHRVVMNSVNVDGSTQTVNFSIDLQVFRQLCIRNDGGN